jgi:tRNA-specific 2-thiouridylase
MSANLQDRRVVVAMSGGIDSSVAAYLLKQAGYEPLGVTFRFWSFRGKQHPDELIARAEKVARQLGILHQTVSVEKEFEEMVVRQFVAEYLRGITPNPCVFCNRLIKWRFLLKIAEELDASFVATGHYVRIAKSRDGSRYQILRGVDRTKDQSYVLWQLSQPALSRTILPLGSRHKSEVRKIASELELPMAGSRESQDVCFLPDNNYRDFLRQYVPEKIAAIGRGELLDESGKVLGFHCGFHNFTIGQRKGFRIGFDQRKYVKQILADKNQVVIANGNSLFSSGMLLRNLNWVSEAPLTTLAGLIQIRYHHRAVRCQAEMIGQDGMRIKFAQKQRAVTPGQSAVLYQDDRLIWGGIIQESLD